MVAAPDTRGVAIPFTRLGAVTSEDLFEPREQVLFDFYEKHAARYRRALDVGANLGIHAVLMARAGWEVRAFEPDPKHFFELRQNLWRNGVEHRVGAECAALSTREGTATFVRVLGNTTANHLEGARASYGRREKFPVRTRDCRAHFAWAQIAKIDVEGHEAALLLTVTPEVRCDFLVEVGSRENAEAIFGHLQGHRPLWVHRGEAWAHIERLEDMPVRYTDGTLFVGEAP